MRGNKQNQFALHLLATMAIVLVCAAVYEWLGRSGMSTTTVWLLLIAGALLLSGIYLLLSGVIFDFSSWLMGRYGKVKPEEVATPLAEIAKPAIPEVTPVAASPESEQNRRVLENAIDTVCRYSDLVFGGTMNDEDKKRVHTYLTDLANMRPLPANVRQIRVDREKINYVDLCHYGWNIWYALKCARNRFYGQQEVVVWLKKCFEPLNRYDERTLRAKLRATDGVSYTLHNNENLKEYLERNDKKR